MEEQDDGWNFFADVNFADEKIKQYHVDTRDFHCATNKEVDVKVDFAKIKKYPERFFHTPVEVMNTLTRLYNESGGKMDWRFLTLDSKDGHSDNWNMKYIRIFRTELGLVVCNNKHYALSKEVLKCKVNQEYLSTH